MSRGQCLVAAMGRSGEGVLGIRFRGRRTVIAVTAALVVLVATAAVWWWAPLTHRGQPAAAANTPPAKVDDDAAAAKKAAETVPQPTGAVIRDAHTGSQIPGSYIVT